MASAAANKVPIYILTLMLTTYCYRGQGREDELCVVSLTPPKRVIRRFYAPGNIINDFGTYRGIISEQ